MPIPVPEAVGDDPLALLYQPIVKPGVKPGDTPRDMWLVEALRRDPSVLKRLTFFEQLELDLQAARIAAATVREWGCRLSLNTLWPYLHRLDYAVGILKALKAANFPPERLILELLESSRPLRDFPGVRPNIQRLAWEGVRFILDDVGTGNSRSPEAVAGILATQPKVDRRHSIIGIKLALELVQNLHTREGFGLADAYVDRALTYYESSDPRPESTLFIAEGVENTEQLDLVQRLGLRCGVQFLVQGYLVSHKTTPYDLLQNPDLRLPFL
jgi:EAL domain-containing protein